jgi:putative ABC transport system permease protein
MHNLLQDIRYGIRILLKNPVLTIVAVIALALGIGANTAIFSIVNGVLLSPLPYPHPDQLVMVWLDNRKQGIRDDVASYPNFLDWRDRNKTFQGMSGMRDLTVNLTGVGEPEELRGAAVSSGFFQLIGVSLAQGRGFTLEEEQPGKDKIIVLGHGLWMRRFGGDPGILNKTISLNGEQHTVVGIMPPGFQFPDKSELWMPLASNERLRAARGALWLKVVGRLKAGVTRAQAQADMDLIAGQLEQQYPATNTGYGINVVSLREQVVGNVRAALMVLLYAVAFVLLIACANVANLLLARASARRHEIAVRATLGAARSRIIRQLLTESVLLSAVGGVSGLLLACWGLAYLPELSPANIPRLDNVHLDGRVLGFTFGLSLLTGMLFGLAPALQISQIDVGDTLKESGRASASRGMQRARSAFIVVEVALTFVLLVGAGLLIRSYWNLQRVNPGFKTDHLLTLQLGLPATKYREGAQVITFYRQLQERLGATPGVESASGASDILLPKLPSSGGISIENRPFDRSEQKVELPYDFVLPNYFQTVGIQLLHGRDFDARDVRVAPRVAIINETFAKRFFPNDDPLGKRFAFGDANDDPQWISIVGVVRDTKRQGLDEPVRIESWIPHAQMPVRGMKIVVRTAGDPHTMAGAMREAVWSLDRDLPIQKMQTMGQVLDERVAQRRLNMLLLGLFAAVALILAAVGVYGVMSYVVTQRKHELGIRVALGARPGDLIRLVVWQGMRLALLGVGAGLIVAVTLTRLMSTLLFGVSAFDPLTFIAIVLLMLLVALLASWIPARRTTKVDPMTALRCE